MVYGYTRFKTYDSTSSEFLCSIELYESETNHPETHDNLYSPLFRNFYAYSKKHSDSKKIYIVWPCKFLRISKFNYIYKTEVAF